MYVDLSSLWRTRIPKGLKCLVLLTKQFPLNTLNPLKTKPKREREAWEGQMKSRFKEEIKG
jgi:hypothetical protein